MKNTSYQEDRIDIHKLLLILFHYRKLIVLFVFITTTIAFIASLFMTPIYRIETTVLPISSRTNVLGSVSNLVGIDVLPVGGLDEDVNKIMVVLQSRTLKENLVAVMRKKNLKNDDIFKPEYHMLIAVEKFQNIISINLNRKTNLITVGVEHQDPELAKVIANSYIKELQKLLNTKSLIVSKMKEKFIREQLKDAANNLTQQQKKMMEFQKKTKIISPKHQTKETMGLYSHLIARKTELEVQLRSLSLALSSKSSEIRSLRNQINLINTKLRKIEGKEGSGVLLSMKDAPEHLIMFSDLKRNIAISMTIYETLLKLYEQTKLEEAHEGLYVQVIDPAVRPLKKYKPKRMRIVAIAIILSGMFCIVLISVIEWIKYLKRLKIGV